MTGDLWPKRMWSFWPWYYSELSWIVSCLLKTPAVSRKSLQNSVPLCCWCSRRGVPVKSQKGHGQTFYHHARFGAATWTVQLSSLHHHKLNQQIPSLLRALIMSHSSRAGQNYKWGVCGVETAGEEWIQQIGLIPVTTGWDIINATRLALSRNFVQFLDGFPKLFMIPGVQPSKFILLCFMHLSHKCVVSRLKSCLVPSISLPRGLFQVLARPKKISAKR